MDADSGRAGAHRIAVELTGLSSHNLLEGAAAIASGGLPPSTGGGAASR